MYSMAFTAAVTLVLELEGGFVHHWADNGGATKYGISSRAHPELDIENLTEGEAIAIYHEDYWVPVADVVTDPRVRMLVFDTAVHSGLSRALSWYESYPDFNDYLAHRIDFLVDLDDWPHFGRGWMRRVSTLVQRANRVQHELARVEALVDNRGMLARLSAALRGISGPINYRIRPMTDAPGLKMDIREAREAT